MLILLLAGTILSLFFCPSAAAARNTLQIRKLKPEESSEAGAVALLLPPGRSQELVYELTNETALKQSYSLELLIAHTDESGQIAYRRELTEEAAQLGWSLEELFSYETELSLAPKEIRQTTITLTSPITPFTGAIEGLLRIIPTTAADSTDCCYSSMITLQQERQEVTPELKLGQMTFSDEQKLYIQLQNPVMTRVSGLDITYKVFDKKGAEPLVRGESRNLNMAPLSSFDYPIDLTDLPPADYSLQLVAFDEKGKRWTFLKEFTLASDTFIKHSTIAEKTSGITDILHLGGILIVSWGVIRLLHLALRQKTRHRPLDFDDKTSK